MKQFLDYTSHRLLLACTLIILILVPFHAFLTVFGSSIIGHYTALRLWEEVLLALLVLAAVWSLLRDRPVRRQLSGSWLVRLIVAFAAFELLAAVVALHAGSASLKAVLYALVIDLRYLAFFLVTLLLASRSPRLRQLVPKIVLLPAAIVLLVGLLQRFVLPHDFLKHFGYNDSTIPPIETIDHKLQYPRIQSTLRGANLLGAYLIIVWSVVLSYLRKYQLTAASVVVLAVLFLSGSRGAWIGALVAALVLGFLEVPGRRNKQLVLAGLVALLLLAGGGVYLLRNNNFVQNTVFHSDEHSHSNESSNAAHLSASRAAAKQVVREPFGRGPGTAGPASIYNTKEPARIAENYFLQIGQELGWAGLVLYLAIYILTGKQLWQRRADRLARALLAAFIGLTCVAMLMHIWADDTVAYLFWGLAGLVLAPSSLKTSHSEVRPLNGKNRTINRGNHAQKIT